MSHAVTNRIAVMHLIRVVLVATTIVFFPTHLFAQALLITSSSSIDFGNQQIDVESDPITLTVTNIGDASATNIHCSVYDRPPYNFPGVFTTGTCPASLTSGSTFEVNVTFTPILVGPAGANHSVDYHDGDNDRSTRVELAGFGIDCDSDGDTIIDSMDSACWGGNPAPAPCTGGATADCLDNCPAVSNPTQEDFDGDGEGDACDKCPKDSDRQCLFASGFESL